MKLGVNTPHLSLTRMHEITHFICTQDCGEQHEAEVRLRCPQMPPFLIPPSLSWDCEHSHITHRLKSEYGYSWMLDHTVSGETVRHSQMIPSLWSPPVSADTGAFLSTSQSLNIPSVHIPCPKWDWRYSYMSHSLKQDWRNSEVIRQSKRSQGILTFHLILKFWRCQVDGELC